MEAEMADTVVHIGENSPEYIAYLLMDRVNNVEDHPKRNREQVLDLYAECLRTVKNPVGRLKEDDRTGRR
jgi:hypothetical protein